MGVSFYNEVGPAMKLPARCHLRLYPEYTGFRAGAYNLLNGRYCCALTILDFGEALFIHVKDLWQQVRTKLTADAVSLGYH